MRETKNCLFLALILLSLILVFWGCAEMIGSKTENIPPTVNFVNTPPDANIDSTTSSWVFNMPFSLFALNPQDSSVFSLYDSAYQLVQFPEQVIWGDTLRVTLVPDTPIVIKRFTGTDTVYYTYGVDYTIEDSTTLVFKAVPPPSGSMEDSIWTQTFFSELADTFIISGTETTWFEIDTMIYLADFKLSTPNFYVFSYAPVVNWYGTDPDGFVEYYSYADLNEDEYPEAIANPAGYIPNIPPAKWVNTPSTFTTIYLLSQEGDTTQHVVYLRCFDNEGAVSTVKYRTFFRTNNAPNTPLVKWDEQADTEYDTVNYIYTDTVGTIYDTLFCLANVTPVWNGIILRWKGTDPDDKELYTIPLTYQYFLLRADSAGEFTDTIPDFSIDTLTDNQDITIINLETGWYKFTVWSFDDGFERSPYPGTLYFRCVKPSYEHSILVYDETYDGTQKIGELVANNVNINAVIDTFYLQELEKLQSYLSGTGYGYTYSNPYDLASGTQDVVYWNNSNASANLMIPVSEIGKYRLVIFYAEDHKFGGTSITYREKRDKLLSRYLNAGGRLWVIGRCLFFASFGEAVGVGITNNDFLNAMQVQQRYAARFPSPQPFEFTAANAAVDFVDTLFIDSAKVAQLYIPFNPPPITGGLPEVDWVARDEDATTLYYFNSITGSLSEAPKDTTGSVMNWMDQPQYPAPNGYQCWITVPDQNLISVSSVINQDKPNSIGEVITVTSDDEILVSYQFIPLQVTNENSQVLDSNSPGGNFPDPTQTACFIRTQRYDQLFSDSGIYNVTRNSYADTVVSITQYNVQVIYPDTIVTVQPGYFDYAEPVFLSATDTSCSLQLNKHIIDDVTYIHNVTKNWDGELSSKVDNVIQVVYFPRPGQQWQDTDSIVVNFQYHQYWEVGDSLSVTYMSDVYWEKGDQVEVQYIYNPVTEAHLKPCAIRYEYYEIYNYTVAQLYYRSAVFTFPLYFMQNEPEPGEVLGRVDKLILEMLDWFLDPNVHLSE